MSASPDLSPREAADRKDAEDVSPEKAVRDVVDEEPAAEAANGHGKADRSPSPRERSVSPARGDSRDKSPADRADDRSVSRDRARSDSRDDRRRRRSDSRDDRRRRCSDSREPRRRRSRSPSYSRDRRNRSRSRSRDRRRRSRSRSRDRYRSSRYSPRRRSSPVVAPYYARPRRTPPRTGTTLFVAGLNFITTEREVEAKFGKYGTCKEARIVRNPMNGESRGFGFVAMKYEEDCDDAIKHLDGAEWNGRRLAVERARNVK
ncbi:hypothetical protein WJX81_000592 [Elliptochloris bilobata]|uniref:RRM domain-containing protein n=1 Tax=Elliptochloris bilobata TaxID=381761 RepID=A0AAW1RRP9_9CHLO